jgi:hypothetical protein
MVIHFGDMAFMVFSHKLLGNLGGLYLFLDP